MKENTLEKIITIVLEVLGALITFWVIVSLIDINVHNLSTCQYACWNIFNLFA